ncbi:MULTISPECIES: hypothetical protein [unclassified Streptomyces]|uniref:hypothetical protein n=1 Tax=unclassified Streptomyces TaxID=2593676 RepID=UPI00166020B5|nr:MULTISPECIES: hypothetical protein [unclassified Streptomyces]MBD0708181.1 hypothetical protein [Streptomyces sp. CBMA291]MBD0714509.1 hypothetical protein [Streptomyces sp. CBMA370]
MSTERRYHPPEVGARPEGLPPETALLVETAVREALRAAVRGAEAAHASAAGGQDRPREPYAEERARAEGYRVRSYDAGGRPVTLPVRGARPVAPVRPVGGLGFGGGARRVGRRPYRWATRPPAPAAAPVVWTEASLARLRSRLGPAYQGLPLGRISVDDLLTGGVSARLVPPSDDEDRGRTIAARLGPGAFHLAPIGREGFGLAAAGALGAGYRVRRITESGGFQDTGVRVITREPVEAEGGILAFTSDFTTLREVRIVGRKAGLAKAAASAVAAELAHGLAAAPPSVVSATLKGLLKDLDDEELMEALEELRHQRRLGELMTLVRVRAFRAFLEQRGVPWPYVLANWEPNASDAAAVFSGVLWGAGENVYQVVELIGVLAGSFFVERLARERHQMLSAAVLFVDHPLVLGGEGLRLLRDTFLEKLERLEFFDAGRIVGQIAMALLTLPKAVASLPKAAASAARLAATATRIGVAALDRIGVAFAEVVEFLLSERQVFAGADGVVFMSVGDDLLLSGTKVRNPVRLPYLDIVDALETGKVPLTEAELEKFLRPLTEAEKQAPKALARTAATGAAVTVEALEELVAQAIAELEGLPGTGELRPSVRGTRLHTIVARLVSERFPGGGGVEVVPEGALRGFSGIPQEILDMPIRTFVERSPAVADLAPRLRSLFKGGSTLIGDMKPDLVLRTPDELVVWDLTSIDRQTHEAKNLLYRAVLDTGGGRGVVGHAFWRHFGKTTAGIEELYPREAARAADLRARIRAILERHGRLPPGGKP